jgi:hypothetical protein
MTEVFLMQRDFKNRAGKRAWLRWSGEVRKRKAEVGASLRREGIRRETCFLSQDGRSVYYFMEVQSLARAYRVYRASRAPVDRDHQRVSEAAFANRVPLRKLFDFRNDQPAGGRRTPRARMGPRKPPRRSSRVSGRSPARER